MKKTGIVAAAILLFSSVVWAKDSKAAIVGDYFEVRTSDVYTGPCFANGEVNLEGQEAILAWRVKEGLWEGVQLDGLSVVAVVKAGSTLGDPFAEPFPARSVVIVDGQANAAQQGALLSLARELGGELLQDTVWVKNAPIQFTAADADGIAYLKAGEFAELKTRALNHHDLICGNEEVYYPPLTSVSAEPAYTLVHRFSGSGLDTTWSSPHKRSAFIGTFSR